MPHADIGSEPVFAGCHRLNGNGELTGLGVGARIGPAHHARSRSRTPTASASCATPSWPPTCAARSDVGAFWSLPVVGETWDGALNDINGFHVKPEHLDHALAHRSDRARPRGQRRRRHRHDLPRVQGRNRHRLTALTAAEGGWTVGALVQANYGRRERLTVDGVPVGREIAPTEIPTPWDDVAARHLAPGAGSIIVILATDAPLLPHQCERIAQRAGLGIARVGGAGEHSSGDLFLAFSTGEPRRDSPATRTTIAAGPFDVTMLPDAAISPLFWAAIEATEEAILNALIAAETLTGIDGVTAHALPHDALVEVMTRYGRGPGAT